MKNRNRRLNISLESFGLQKSLLYYSYFCTNPLTYHRSSSLQFYALLSKMRKLSLMFIKFNIIVSIRDLGELNVFYFLSGKLL